jgi:hypothetical protein
MGDLHRLTTKKISALGHGRATRPAAKITGGGTLLGATESDAPRTHRVRQPSARIAFVLAATFLAAVACSGKGAGTGTPELPPACDAFVAKYEACVKASVPSMPAVAKERAAQTRAALEKEVERASVGTDTPNLTALVTKCQDNLQRLTTSCGSSRKN